MKADGISLMSWQNDIVGAVKSLPSKNLIIMSKRRAGRTTCLLAAALHKAEEENESFIFFSRDKNSIFETYEKIKNFFPNTMFERKNCVIMNKMGESRVLIENNFVQEVEDGIHNCIFIDDIELFTYESINRISKCNKIIGSLCSSFIDYLGIFDEYCLIDVLKPNVYNCVSFMRVDRSV